MNPSDDKLADLARLAEATASEEIDCAEMLNRVAAYLHARTERAQITEPLKQVAQHLNICPECLEEFKALLAAEGIEPETVINEGHRNEGT